MASPSSQAPSIRESLSLLGRYTPFLVKNRKTGLEEGLAFLPRTGGGELPDLAEFMLEQLEGERKEQEELISPAGTSVILSTLAYNLDTNHNAISAPSTITPHQALKLPPSLSITPCLPTTTIPPTTPPFHHTNHTMSHGQVSEALSALVLPSPATCPSSRLRTRSRPGTGSTTRGSILFPTTDKSESKEAVASLDPDWAGCAGSEQSGGGQMCTIRAVGGMVRHTVGRKERRGEQESGSFSVLKVLERLGVELNTAPVGKKNRGKVECSVCKRFYTASYLSSHMERKHGEKKKVEEMGSDVEQTLEKIKMQDKVEETDDRPIDFEEGIADEAKVTVVDKDINVAEYENKGSPLNRAGIICSEEKAVEDSQKTSNEGSMKEMKNNDSCSSKNDGLCEVTEPEGIKKMMTRSSKNLHLVSTSPEKKIQTPKKPRRRTVGQTIKRLRKSLKKELKDGRDWIKHIDEDDFARSSRIEFESEYLVCQERDDADKLVSKEESGDGENSGDKTMNTVGMDMKDSLISFDGESISRGDILGGNKSTSLAGVEASKDDKPGTFVNMKDETREQLDHNQSNLLKDKTLTGQRGGKAVKMVSCSLCLLVLRKDGMARHLARHKRKEEITDSEEISNVGKKRKVDETAAIVENIDGGVAGSKICQDGGVVTTQNCQNFRVVTSVGNVLNSSASSARDVNNAEALPPLPSSHGSPPAAVTVSSLPSTVDTASCSMPAGSPAAFFSSPQSQTHTSPYYTASSHALGSPQSHASPHPQAPYTHVSPHPHASSHSNISPHPHVSPHPHTFPHPHASSHSNASPPSNASPHPNASSHPQASPHSTDRVTFTMKGLGSVTPSGRGKLFSVSMKPNVLLEKGMAAFGGKFGVDVKHLEFMCKGRVLSGDQLVSDVEGCLVLVRNKEGGD